MILNNKMFKLSSLCIMGTVAVAMSQIISSNLTNVKMIRTILDFFFLLVYH